MEAFDFGEIRSACNNQQFDELAKHFVLMSPSQQGYVLDAIGPDVWTRLEFIHKATHSMELLPHLVEVPKGEKGVLVSHIDYDLHFNDGAWPRLGAHLWTGENPNGGIALGYGDDEYISWDNMVGASISDFPQKLYDFINVNFLGDNGYVIIKADGTMAKGYIEI